VALAAFATLIALASNTANADDNEVRWRVFDEGGEALLAIVDTDEPTDNLGVPLLSCKDGMGAVNIEGVANEKLRVAMAEMMRADVVPEIQVIPDATPGATSIELFYSYAGEGWRYKFLLQENHAAFERFRREGVLEFKLGDAAIHEEFKVGLENVGKFLELCKPKSNKQ
jgi:hypothetical protein